MHADTRRYNEKLAPDDRAIGDLLAREIERVLPEAENKVWHGHPVWFLRGNPVVGYGKLKDCVRLLFWSGQSFDEPGLAKEGKFKAAEVRYTAADRVSVRDLERWLVKARDIQWDYANLARRKGRLDRLASTVGEATERRGATVGRAPRQGVMKRPATSADRSASERIDERIAELGDWRGATLRRVRELIHQAVPDVVEEWKWRGTPVWSHDGILCTGESYKAIVKLTFAKGASLPDPKNLFNASLEGSTRRAIDLHEGEGIDARAFQALIRVAVASNAASRKAKPKRAR